MTLLYWNYQGFSSPPIVRALHRLIQTTKPFIIFLLEIKCLKNKMDSIRMSLGFDCGFFVDRVVCLVDLVLFGIMKLLFLCLVILLLD